MDHYAAERIFRLSARGVDCDDSGLHIGGIDLLARETWGWRVREQSETDGALSDVYGFPVDTSVKRAGLRAIANALTNKELARAQIAALFLQLPDPPFEGSAERMDLARALASCGLLKADPDWEAEHPRTGTPPNPGWFANKPKQAEAKPAPGRQSTWPPKDINEKVREFAKGAAAKLTRRGLALLIYGTPYLDAIAVFLETLAPQPTNQWELRVEQQLQANFSTPKSLEELQQRPEGDTFGYELHHIVEQNDSNVIKDSRHIPRDLEKFGQEAIDDDSNTVWIPRLQHEEITAYYNSSPDGGQPFRRYRDQVNTLDFATQRQIGLDNLRKFGVLK